MFRLLNTEWEKLRNYRAFWVMVILYLFVLFSMIFAVPALLDYIAEHAKESLALRAFKAIVFNFPDIWQNLSFVAGMRGFIKIFLAILVVVFISNEFSYLTVRTNILNGMSRAEFVSGKLQVIFLLALLSTFAVFVAGLYLGLTQSPVISFSAIIGKTQYLLAYFLEVFTYLTFALLIGVLIRKTGFSVIVLLLYLIIEPIIQYYVPDDYDKFLPLNAMNHVVWSPNTSLIKVKTPEMNFDFQEYISWADAGVCFGYAVIFITLVYVYLRKKDL